MSSEHFLVTGGMGCIGAWVVRNLVQSHVPVTVFDLSTDDHRLKLILDADEIARIRFAQGDITNAAEVQQVVETSGATHIIHLAALQVPGCKANPSLGAAVNVVGTVNVFEAARAAGLPRVVYASSAAVYGTKSSYNERLLPHDAPLLPQTLYGVYKQANEQTAAIYWQDHQLASIGLRPYTVYGPGRDQGLTSAPTQAMVAAARGEPFHISFGGTCGYQYVDDVAKIFIQAARASFQGAATFNLKGSVASMAEMVGAIEAVVPSIRGQITCSDNPLPFPEGMEDTALRQALGHLPQTSLYDGVAQTIAHFQKVSVANA